MSTTPTNDGGSKLGISELIAYVGDENITVQNLAHNLLRFDKRKGFSELEFSASPEDGQAMAKELAGIDSGRIALILWFPKDKLPPALAARNQTTK